MNTKQNKNLYNISVALLRAQDFRNWKMWGIFLLTFRSQTDDQQHQIPGCREDDKKQAALCINYLLL